MSIFLLQSMRHPLLYSPCIAGYISSHSPALTLCSVTLDVSKLLKSRLVRLLQPWNMDPILVTLEVSRSLKSGLVRLLQPWNMDVQRGSRLRRSMFFALPIDLPKFFTRLPISDAERALVGSGAT